MDQYRREWHFHKQTFTFDTIGNLTGRTIMGNPDGAEQYQYDSANRLSQRKIGAGAWQTVATYDGVGNIKTKLNVGGTYTYDANSLPHAARTAGGRAYTYDANGSVLTRTFNDSTFPYHHQLSIEWYDFNQPKEFYWYRPVEGNTAKSAFAYDASFQRVAQDKWLNGSLTGRTLYALGGIEQEQVKDAQGVWQVERTRITIQGPGGALGMIEHNAQATAASDHQRYFFHLDHLGSVCAITKAGGGSLGGIPEAVTRFTYNEWGQQTERNWSSWTAVANSGEFTRGFTMHEHLKDLGLIHMNGRVYDPLIGRFLSADPHIQAPGDLQNYNRYSYVNNNPLSFTDPLFKSSSLRQVTVRCLTCVGLDEKLDIIGF